MAVYTSKQIQLFWSHVDIKDVDDCWNWKLSTDRSGYGKVKINAAMKIAHRVAYEICFGEVSSDVNVMHDCDNPICCNPKHLQTGSFLKNMQDMIQKGRQRSVYTPRKLNQKIANQIRDEFNSQKIGKRALARKYGISPSNVRSILKGEIWNHPTTPPHYVQLYLPNCV